MVAFEPPAGFRRLPAAQPLVSSQGLGVTAEAGQSAKELFLVQVPHDVNLEDLEGAVLKLDNARRTRGTGDKPASLGTLKGHATGARYKLLMDDSSLPASNVFAVALGNGKDAGLGPAVRITHRLVMADAALLDGHPFSSLVEGEPAAGPASQAAEGRAAGVVAGGAEVSPPPTQTKKAKRDAEKSAEKASRPTTHPAAAAAGPKAPPAPAPPTDTPPPPRPPKSTEKVKTAEAAKPAAGAEDDEARRRAKKEKKKEKKRLEALAASGANATGGIKRKEGEPAAGEPAREAKKAKKSKEGRA